MKIIYVTSESFMDHSYTIASELKKAADPDLKTYITAKKKSEEINNFCLKLGAVFVKRRRFINPFNLFLELKFLYLISLQQCDSIWFNTLSFYQAIFLKFFIKKYLINIHDAELHPAEKNLYTVLTRWVTIQLYKKNICLASKTQASLFENKFGRKPKIFQLPVIDYYEAVSRNSSPAGRQISIPVRFLFFGTILPYKGIEILLDACGILEKNGVKYVLNICGKIKYNKTEITGRIKKLNQIKLQNEFINYTEVHSVFLNNDVLILPYTQVTQCGPLLIAYNRNMPSICNDLPGFTEYVDDEKSGMLFSGTAESLAGKMKEIIDNPGVLQNMSKYISEKIKNRFSMHALRKEYIANFEDCR